VNHKGKVEKGEQKEEKRFIVANFQLNLFSSPPNKSVPLKRVTFNSPSLLKTSFLLPQDDKNWFVCDLNKS
jgi:hypothetical protein